MSDVLPALRGHKAGEMSGICSCRNHFIGCIAEGKRLGSQDHIAVEGMAVGRRLSSLPDRRPKLSGAAHD